MLFQRYPIERLYLLCRADWHPYPTIAEREAWDRLPESVRRAHLAQAETALGQGWPVLCASRYLDFARNGNRSEYERAYFARRGTLESLVIAECIEGQGRFLDDIADGVWLICEESTWCVPAHVGVQREGMGLADVNEPIVDLFAAETSALLAWTAYLVGPRLDAVSPLIGRRMLQEVDRRVLAPCLQRDDFWWMGFGSRSVNNWNPWINSNWLATALLMEPDEERRRAAVAKSMRSIDRFVDPYPHDGGCDEGPGYWGRAGASLFDCLELLLSATGGQVNVYDEPLVQDIGRFIYRVHIDDAYFVNFADASAMVVPPPYVVFRYGQRIGDLQMAALGTWAAHRRDLLCQKGKEMTGRGEGLGRLLPTLFGLSELYSLDPRPPLPRDVWLDQIQVMVARDQGGASAGLCVAAKGGHNAESHNHNDVGHVIIYVDGRPVIVDAGVETYTRKTFGAERYTIWTMQSAYHSLPTIDGVMQAPGRQFAARDVSYRADDQLACFSLDIAGAYPPEAKLSRWQRTVTLRRGQEVEIQDTYELAAPVREIALSLLTACQVGQDGPGRLALSEALLAEDRMSGKACLTYDPDKVVVSVEQVLVNDARLRQVWGDRLARILFQARNPPLRDTWTVQIAAM